MSAIKRSKTKTTIYIDTEQAILLEFIREKYQVNIASLIRDAIQVELIKRGLKLQVVEQPVESK